MSCRSPSSAARARARRADARRRRAVVRRARRRSQPPSSPTSTAAARTSGRAARAKPVCCTSASRRRSGSSPTVVSLYGGAVGVSRRLEANGQRDEAAMIAFGEAMVLQKEIGTARIEARARALSKALADGLRKIDGVKVWTSPDPDALGEHRQLPARVAGHPPAQHGALREGSHRLRDARRHRPRRPALLTALLQLDERNRSHRSPRLADM